MKSIYKGGQFQTGDFAQILTGVYTGMPSRCSILVTVIPLDLYSFTIIAASSFFYMLPEA